MRSAKAEPGSAFVVVRIGLPSLRKMTTIARGLPQGFAMTRSKNQLTNNSATKRWIAETLFDDLGFRMTFAVDRVLYEVLVPGLQLVQYLVDFEGHAEPEIVEQRFSDPTLGGRIVRRSVV